MGAKRRKSGAKAEETDHAPACNTNLFAANSKFHIANYSHIQAPPDLPTSVSKPLASANQIVTRRGAQESASSSDGEDEPVRAVTGRKRAEKTEKAGKAKKSKTVEQVQKVKKAEKVDKKADKNVADKNVADKNVADKAEKDDTPGGKRDKPKDGPKTKDELLHELKDEALGRTIFIGNLAESTTKKQLKKRFRQYGVIESIRFRSMLLKKDSRVPRRVAAAAGTVDEERGSHHAYLVFEDATAVPKSLQENMKVLDDRHIRVDRAAVNNMRVKLLGAKKGSRAAAELVGASHQVQYDVSKTVFVGNLPLQVEDEELIRFFIAGLGSGSDSLIQAVRVVRDPKTSVGKGIAFVMFKNRGARKQALALHGKALQGRKLRISEAQADGNTEAAQYKRHGNNSQKSKPWQGATSSKSGRVRGGVAKKTASSYAKTLRSASKRPQMPKRTGKRPAVAARKAAAKSG